MLPLQTSTHHFLQSATGEIETWHLWTLAHAYARILALLSLLIISNFLIGADVVPMGNDATFQQKLDLVQNEKPQETGDLKADKLAVLKWLYELSDSYMNMRRYADMEVVCKTLIDLSPSYALNHTNLSIAYGKQGKFTQAIEEAQIAALLAPGNSMHADAVLCSWLLLSGKRQAALDRFASIAVPQGDKQKLADYYECKACFCASVGDHSTMIEAMSKTLDINQHAMAFFQRDIVFDPYRGEPKFIALVGTTLAKP